MGAEGQATITDNTLTASNVLLLSVGLQNTAGTNEPLDGTGGGNLVFTGNSLIGGGSATLDVSNCGTGAFVDDAHGLLALAGSPGNSMTGFTNFTLDSGATYDAGSNNAQVVFVAPDADTIILTPGHAALTIDGATAANTILQFQGYGAALDRLGQLSGDTTAGGGSTTIDIPGDGKVTLASTSWSPTASDANFVAACYAAGTRILTLRGEVPVETLGAGDRVVTRSGASAPVVWTGHRHVDCRRHPRPADAWPVRIAADAFAPGRPHRDLWLSPDHAVHVDGMLVPAHALLNGVTIVQMPVDTVTYWHLELSRHDVVYAEGLPAESYLDTGNRAAFEDGSPKGRFKSGFGKIARRWTSGTPRSSVTGCRWRTCASSDGVRQHHPLDAAASRCHLCGEREERCRRS